jgi:hypothetical protein
VRAHLRRHAGIARRSAAAIRWPAMRVPSVAALGLVVAGALASATAAADERGPAVRFEFAAPMGCPGATDFLRELEGRGASVHAPGPGEKSPLLRVDIQLVGLRVVGNLVVIEPDGQIWERSIVATSCRAATDALALIVALALERSDNMALRPGIRPLSAPLPVPPPAPRPMPPAGRPPMPSAVQPAVENVDAKRPTWSFSASAAGFIALGMAPEPTAGWTVLAGMSVDPPGSLERALLRVGVWGMPSRSFSVTGGSASFSTLVGIAEVCPTSFRLWSEGHLFPCLVGEYGEYSASGLNGKNAIIRPWAGAGIGTWLSLTLFGPAFFEVSTQVIFAIDRNRFELGSESVYETPLAVGRIGVGIGVRVP